MARGYVTVSWGFGLWCNFNIPLMDSSPLAPTFGEMGKLPQISPPQISPKNLTVPSFVDLSSGITCENGKIFCQKRDERCTLW